MLRNRATCWNPIICISIYIGRMLEQPHWSAIMLEVGTSQGYVCCCIDCSHPLDTQRFKRWSCYYGHRSHCRRCWIPTSFAMKFHIDFTASDTPPLENALEMDRWFCIVLCCFIYLVVLSVLHSRRCSRLFCFVLHVLSVISTTFAH